MVDMAHNPRLHLCGGLYRGGRGGQFSKCIVIIVAVDTLEEPDEKPSLTRILSTIKQFLIISALVSSLPGFHDSSADPGQY